jgi:hypothetical protein
MVQSLSDFLDKISASWAGVYENWEATNDVHVDLLNPLSIIQLFVYSLKQLVAGYLGGV